MNVAVCPIDETHDPARQSWVASANAPETDFPVQNLPFGRYRRPADPHWRIGVAIGDQVLDLERAGLLAHQDMHRLMRLSADERQTLRRQLSQGLTRGSAQAGRWAEALLPMQDLLPGTPCEVGDYTDFYVGIHHATAVGKLFRPDNPLLPNYKWLPVGYHGRASTLCASGQGIVRPTGQIRPVDADAPVLAPSARLDFELELGIFIGRGNPIGGPVPMTEAESHVFGLTLLNDWSARDIQAWEYQPLGPFLSKSFATTISPWIVTLEALAPFRQRFSRPVGDPPLLPYLDSAENRASGAIDIGLEVLIRTRAMRDRRQPGEIISRSGFAQAAYWTTAQLVTHHTVNGCALNTGDLFGSGTLSGPLTGQAGSLLELTEGGQRPITLANGEQRRFLEDGDCIGLRGRCDRQGFRSIGFGDCLGWITAARAPIPYPDRQAD